MKELIVKIQPFTMKQSIFIKDNDKIIEQKVDYRNLPCFIAECDCLDSVHIFGNEKQAKKIMQECKLKYKVNTQKVNFVLNE